MSHRITFIPGDGVGPEVTAATRRVLEATGVKFDWEIAVAGDAAQDLYGTPLPDYLLESVRRNRVALKGPITTPVGYGFRSVNVALRKTLDLYACLRPCKLYPGAPSRYDQVDLVVVRENTEDLYIGIEFERGTPAQERLLALVAETAGQKLGEDTGVSLKVITERGTRRIIQFAFDYARKHGRRKVTAVHKANILKYSDGLFLSVAREVARGYGDIEFEDIIVDTLCMQLVRRPERFDVLVLPNLYGDFVSELCAGLIGGLGLAPGANIGDGFAVFEPTHGSAPKYAGMNRVNPMAMMLSGVLMLRHLGEKKAADRLEGAIARVIQEGKKVTYDLKRGQGGNPATTSEVAEAVLEALTREG
ncbi:MAG TPA: isocitrate/isopropylmalate dehydrogenase family protein [Dehalococcoidia bacterium]|nr:isocitrate/isopropylmalate dehydrogenase family protein [Dehalococcoidia bacterium]